MALIDKVCKVTHNGETFECAKALKGDNYIHLLDYAGIMIVAFDNVTDFSSFTIEDGSWQTPVAVDECFLAVIGEDGVIRKGSHKCSDIGDIASILDYINGEVV